MAASQENSPAFQSWFYDSKVVNPDGTPRIVYHGTRAGVRVVEFDRRASGRKNADTVGSWFTTLEQASLYGPQIIPVYLSLQNPLVIEGLARHELAEYQSLLQYSSDEFSRLPAVVRAEARMAEILAVTGRFERGTRGHPGEAKEYQTLEDGITRARGTARCRLDELRKRDSLSIFFEIAMRACRVKQGVNVDGRKFRGELIDAGHDGVVMLNTVGDSADARPPADMFIAFYPEQIKHATENSGAFDHRSNNIYENPVPERELKAAGRTAISRQATSLPMRYLAGHGLLVGRTLDFGCGRGYDAHEYGMEKYDPNHFPKKPTGKFDTITCNYVLNVVKEKYEPEILSEIFNLLKVGGIAYLAVRRDIVKDGVTASGTYQRRVFLDLPVLTERKGAYATYVLEKG